MARVLVVVVALAMQVASPPQSPQRRPIQADGVVRLLSDLEAALVATRPGAVSSLASADLSDTGRQLLMQAAAAGPADSAAVRERARRTVADGVEVLAELFIERGRVGRLTTWLLTARPIVEQPERFELVGLRELASIDNLLKLALDDTTQYALDDFVLEAPDLRLSMRSGSAFVARSPTGVTGMVLRGRGELRFAPADPAEQGQLRIFAGDPAYVTDLDAVFLRMNSAEFMLRIGEKGLSTVPVDRREFDRAAEIFASMAPLTFNLDLDDLTGERWSIEPTYGSIVVESRTRRHGWLTYARTPSDAEDVAFFDRANNRNLSAYSSEAALARRDSRFYDEDDRAAYDVQSYSLDLSFDPAREWLTGRATVRLRVRPPGANSLTLRLASSLTVSSVSSPELGRLLTLRVSGQNNVLVGLPHLVIGGTDLVLDVQYAGRLAPQGLDRESLFVDQQAQFQDPPQLIQTPEPRFMYSNRALWYPQAPVSDFATATMRLTVPSEYQIVASGTPTGSSVATVAPPEGSAEQPRSLRTVEYVADRPARYLGVVISRFVPIARTRAEVTAVAPAVASAVVTRPPDGPPNMPPGVDIEVVSTPRMAGRNRNLPARVEDMIRFFAARIGEAPYPDFTLAAVDDNLPGGHSPAFFAVLHQPLPSTPFQWSQDPVWFGNYPRLFLAHEVAHQWWGQAVGWKNYHEQWLSEGLAQYFAVLYAESDRGDGLMRNLLSSMRDTAERESAQGPIYLGYRLGHIQGRSAVFRSVVYNKSAVVLHMLRGLIGDEAFFGGLRRFYSEWRFRKAGTDNLRDAFEAGTSIDLDRFFERWVLGATLPDVRVSHEIAGDRLSAIVRIRQLGEVFDLPLPITVQYTVGADETFVVPVTTNAIDFPIKGDRQIRRITVDDSLIPGEIRS